MNSVHRFKRWLKTSDRPLAKCLFRMAKSLLTFEIPVIRPLHSTLYAVHRLVSGGIDNAMRVLYWTPLFKTRLLQSAPKLYLYGGMPYLSGPLRIRIGSNCRVSGQTTFSGRTVGDVTPELIVGNNVDIGWQTTIAVGRRVVIGDNARIAGRAFLAGYPGHPLDAAARAAGATDNDDQVGDIILENDVWLATGVSVMTGVTIGQGTIVAAGSVVTKSLPPGVLAGGCPARVIRSLGGDNDNPHA